ncbi:uncharacterized protein TOT_030000609 [Theileria orientalis strain Shintoku]|uniref:Uncharacterized protein n=1 Tax=Theileria orientalis strain Shintoku TaxID=869250 RepID=J4CDL4_THEOR|nr:uncharacterized protein TOT_030000609 [Theileria orientalis strain Shintoku]PVC49684.1 hypothetical protein MACL_00002826 [Theileria orientalis]BAM41347.1 uncharacterized protein TOT_030000609 [Theileria orientalis strain Shintoku]|eukprot:XP_009691648.1 uncharacterized protein TOT_030000609 [Theileria orientalis strain Shintoku]
MVENVAVEEPSEFLENVTDQEPEKANTPPKFFNFFKAKNKLDDDLNNGNLESKGSEESEETQNAKDEESNKEIRIEVFESPDIPEQLNHGMLCTLHYMKYREAIRRYTGEFKNCPYGVCIANILMVLCVILTTSLVSQHFDPTDPGTVRGNTSKTWVALYLSNANNLGLIVVILTTLFSIVNLYICVHPNTFVKIVSISKMTVRIYFILYPVLMFYNYSMNVSLQEAGRGENLRAVFNIRAYNILGIFFYDTFFLTIYTVLIIFFNLIAFIYRFFYPTLLMTIINEDVRTFKVTEFEEIKLNLPNIGSSLNNKDEELGKIPAFRVTITRFRKPNSLYYSFKYLIDFLHFKKRGSYDSFQYVGQLNSEYRPHGFGFWNSPNFHGELLMGFWESGLPLSPFKSREVGTNAGFSNVIIGWVRYEGGDSAVGLGVAAAECCVSGPFFRTFPRILRFYTVPETDGKRGGRVLKLLKKLFRRNRLNCIAMDRMDSKYYCTDDHIVMSLNEVSNDIVGYRYGNVDSYINGKKNPYFNVLKKMHIRDIFQDINELFGIRETGIPLTTFVNCMECLLSALTLHAPNFTPLDSSNLSLSVDDERGINIHGFVKKPKINEDGIQEFSSDYCKSVKALEAWIYIHGFNVKCIDSLGIFAQIISFGNYPQYIKPFVFSWPSGNKITQFKEAIVSSTCPKTVDTFIRMLQALLVNNIRDVHIMTHSMGATMFLGAFTQILNSKEYSNLFLKLNEDRDANNPKLKILTVTLLNPFYPVYDFVQNDYPRLKQYCSHITIYSDVNDKALKVAELITGKKRLGRCVNELYTMEERVDETAKRCTLGSIVLPFTLEEVRNLKKNKKKIKEIIENRKKKHWLDVDVIDTTCLGSNVHALRHSYWFLNREVIEDLRDLIVNRKRAQDRSSRLDRSLGNTWVYRVAPSNLNTLFETII